MPSKTPLPAKPPLQLRRPKDEPTRLAEAVKVGGQVAIYRVSKDFGKPVSLGKIAPGTG